MLKNRFILFGLPLFLLCSLFGYLHLPSRPSSKPQVYDCFLFFNEFELLKIRLQEMSPHVDHFVLVEATETFRGAPKPLNFKENSHLFEEFKDKIIYIPLTDHFETDNAWERERFQRAQVLQGLKGCQNTDIVLLSDLDEIVKGSRIGEIVELITSKQTQAVICEQKMYYGYLNRYWTQWPGTVATTYKQAKKIGIKSMRRVRNQKPRALRKIGIHKVTLLPDAGWHFTSMGGRERYVEKIQSYSHREFDRPELKTEEHFTKTVEGMTLVRVDDTFPSCVQQDRAYFEQIGFIDTAQ